MITRFCLFSILLAAALPLVFCQGNRAPEIKIAGSFPYDPGREHQRDFFPTGELEQLSDNLYLLRDCCNVYLVRDGDKALLIDFGSGKILDHLAKLGVSGIDKVLVTHHHRDQLQGLCELDNYSFDILVPAGEAHLIEGAGEFWKNFGVHTDLYRCRSVQNTIRRSVPVDEKVSGGDVIQWRGKNIRVLDTPGHTDNSISYCMEVDGRQIVFCGDLISAPGKVTHWYDLHWDYYGFTQGVDASDKSFERIKAREPGWLAPSHGSVIEEPLRAMEANSRIYERVRPLLTPNELHRPTSEMYQILPHLVFLGGTSYAIISDSGKAFIYDFGFNWNGDADYEVLRKFMKDYGVKEIDAVSFSHHHYDHKDHIVDVFRVGSPQLWVFENMVDIFENPSHYRIPNMGLPVLADRVLREGEKVRWEEFTLEFFAFPSQLERHQALFTVIDGKRVLFTGDGTWKKIDPDRRLNGPVVPLNGYFMDGGYITSSQIMLDYMPEIVCPAHTGEYYPSREDLEGFHQWALDVREVMTEVIDQPDPNFGMDKHWCVFHPYRVTCRDGGSFRVELIVRNHLFVSAQLEVKLKLPGNLLCEHAAGSIRVGGKKQVVVPFVVEAAAGSPPERMIITADVTINGQHLGEYAEAIVEIKPGESKYRFPY
jgi:glyoxylase-like metal-dependent hydrolase (beta-lactamase superfamily II)